MGGTFARVVSGSVDVAMSAFEFRAKTFEVSLAWARAAFGDVDGGTELGRS